MQHLVEVVAGDAHDRVVLRQADVTVLRHVDGHPQRGGARALADTRLEHPELALLDGELGVAHVAVVRLEPAEDRHELGVDLGELAGESVEVFGVANARDDIFTLRVHEEVPVRLVLARGGVAGETDARARVVVTVAEHHRLDVHRGAEIVADALAHPVRDGAGAVPAAEHGLDGAAQLRHRVLGERASRGPLHDLLVLVAQLGEIASRDVGIALHAGCRLRLLERLVELDRRRCRARCARTSR